MLTVKVAKGYQFCLRRDRFYKDDMKGRGCLIGARGRLGKAYELDGMS